VSTSMYWVTTSECLHIKKRLRSSKPNMTRLGLWRPNNDEFAWKIQAIVVTSKWCDKTDAHQRRNHHQEWEGEQAQHVDLESDESEVEICTCEITIVSLM
jgi:hypothetical protein